MCGIAPGEKREQKKKHSQGTTCGAVVGKRYIEKNEQVRGMNIIAYNVQCASNDQRNAHRFADNIDIDDIIVEFMGLVGDRVERRVAVIDKLEQQKSLLYMLITYEYVNTEYVGVREEGCV